MHGQQTALQVAMKIIKNEMTTGIQASSSFDPTHTK